jgi:hypothetical protein
MKLDALLSTIILVSVLVTIIMAVGSYVAYKLREARRPQLGQEHASPRALADVSGASRESVFFEQIRANDADDAPDATLGSRRG